MSLLREIFIQHRSYQPSGRFIGELHHRGIHNHILFFLSMGTITPLSDLLPIYVFYVELEFYGYVS